LPFAALNDVYRMVFVNGYFVPQWSLLPEKLRGVTVTTMREAAGKEAYEDSFDKIVDHHAGFTSLNAALYTDGAFIRLEKGAAIDKPVFLYFVAQSEEDAYFIQPRNLVIADENAEAKIVEVFVSQGAQASLTNIITEIEAGPDARLDYTKLQLEDHHNFHIGTTQIRQDRQSAVDTHIISLDGAFIRNNLHFLMTDKHCSSILNGLYLVHDDEFLDNHTQVDHAVPECFSDQLYKGIIDDKGTGVFNGKVQVRKDAQKTNAYQRNVNILLSDDAVINTKPQLEIYADDVRCTHGATTGYLNEEAVFYLRSRGIGESDARLLLMNAFAGEIVEKLNVEALKQPLSAMIAAKLSRASR
jgi:Fe-S cluster assembly protein SufD